MEERQGRAPPEGMSQTAGGRSKEPRIPERAGDRVGLSWKPGAILRYGLLLVIDLALGWGRDIHSSGRARIDPGRPALLVTNHRRDSDGPLVGSLLLHREGLRFRGPLPHFVAREDLFHRGFLRRYLTSWPGWARELLAPIGPGRLLRGLNVHPMRRFPEQTLGEVLADVRAECGDLPLTEVLRPGWVERFRALGPGAEGPLRVGEALGRRYRPLLDTPFGLRRLTLHGFRRIKPRQRRVVEGQVGEVVARLNDGSPVHLVPEGGVSPHGGRTRVREALHRFLAVSDPRTAVLPLGISHDDLTTGRPRAFLAVGEELSELEGVERREREERVIRAIRARTTVTVSQIAAARILELGSAGSPVTPDGLEAHVRSEAERLGARGAPLDPLLTDPGARPARVTAFLRFGERHGLLRPEADGYRILAGRLAKPDPWRPEGRVPYAANEYAELLRLWAGSESGA